MNLSYRKQVDNYTEECDIEPLGFYMQKWNPSKIVYEYEPVEVLDMSVKELGLVQVVVNTLNHNYEYASGINNYMETGPLALRSVIDIWRHIKKYNPEISIYEVMKCIADNHEEMNLYSHFCGTIERRVFTISDEDEYGDYPREINDDDYDDEFGLYFSQWSDL